MTDVARREASFWFGVSVRMVGVALAGLALIFFFQQMIAPVLRADVERAQKEHKGED